MHTSTIILLPYAYTRAPHAIVPAVPACCFCGAPPAARFAEDQVFTEIIETQIKAVYLLDGDWYVRLDGDLAGRVTGAVYDASQGDDTLLPIPVSVSA
jgi:hypothetical protein